MTDKTLVGLGIVAVATPLLAFWLSGGPEDHRSVASPTTVPVVSHAIIPSIASAQVSKLANPPLASAPKAPPVPVKPSDLENLAQMVTLTDAPKQDFKKEQWAKAIPLAQKLANSGMCDCEQRNWLMQFIDTGNEAIAGSPDYYKRAQFLATLYRNDQELATGVPSN